MSFLNPSNLEKADYNLPGWVHIFNRNLELLNETLLKAENLGDVNKEALAGEGYFVWDSTQGKYVIRRYD